MWSSIGLGEGKFRSKFLLCVSLALEWNCIKDGAVILNFLLGTINAWLVACGDRRLKQFAKESNCSS